MIILTKLKLDPDHTFSFLKVRNVLFTQEASFVTFLIYSFLSPILMIENADKNNFIKIRKILPLNGGIESMEGLRNTKFSREQKTVHKYLLGT